MLYEYPVNVWSRLPKYQSNNYCSIILKFLHCFFELYGKIKKFKKKKSLINQLDEIPIRKVIVLYKLE